MPSAPQSLHDMRELRDSWDHWDAAAPPDSDGPRAYLDQPGYRQPAGRRGQRDSWHDDWDRRDAPVPHDPHNPHNPYEAWDHPEPWEPRAERASAQPRHRLREADPSRHGGRSDAWSQPDPWGSAERRAAHDPQEPWDQWEREEPRDPVGRHAQEPRHAVDSPPPWAANGEREPWHGTERLDAGHRRDFGDSALADDPIEEPSWAGSEELPLFGEPERKRRPVDRRTRHVPARGRVKRRRGRRAFGLFIVVALLAGLGVGAWFGYQELRGIGHVPDYAGTGETDVIAHVQDGASTSEIAAELAKLDVVASSKAFVNAALNNTKIRSVQPGYYRMRTRMSGASAVALLLEPASRVGQLEIRGGMQLDDVQLPDGKIVPGILTLISNASKVDLNGQSAQVPVEQLRQAMETTDPAALGVPAWAIPGVQAAEPKRRLEGLLMPGSYDVKPGASAVELLKSAMAASALRLQATQLTDETKDTGFRPYELLVIASLVEKEGITADFGKVSRVIYNRLANQMPLAFDSTINYPLDRQEVRTTGVDRSRPGPYNTYLNPGLPPTPIGSPSEKAIAAAVEPAPGGWKFFVKCQTDGTSCFAETAEQHQANVDDARARGIF